MLKSNKIKNYIKLYCFFLLWWIVSVIIGSIWGLGWFFLVVTLRNIVTHIPMLRNKLRRIILGQDFEEDKIIVNPTAQTISHIMNMIIIIFWICITIFVFVKANISLEMVLEYIRSVK